MVNDTGWRDWVRLRRGLSAHRSRVKLRSVFRLDAEQVQRRSVRFTLNSPPGAKSRGGGMGLARINLTRSIYILAKNCNP